MRRLFDIDKKDHSECTYEFRRDSARGIIVKDGRVAMIHSMKYDYYKFPGGGIEAGEAPEEAMIREVLEEAGLVVIPETIREFGIVHRVQRGMEDPAERFVQDNYYYLCDAEDGIVPQNLDDYEEEASFQLEFADPREVIRKNLSPEGSPAGRTMREREARVLEMLIEEGIIQP